MNMWPARVCVRHEKCISAAGEAATPRMSFLGFNFWPGVRVYVLCYAAAAAQPVRKHLRILPIFT